MTVPRSQSPPTGSCRAPPFQSRRTQGHLRAWRCTGLSGSPKGLPRKSCGRLSACWWLQESLRDQDDFISQLSPAIDLVSNRRAVRQDRWPRPLSTFLELSSRGYPAFGNATEGALIQRIRLPRRLAPLGSKSGPAYPRSAPARLGRGMQYPSMPQGRESLQAQAPAWQELPVDRLDRCPRESQRAAAWQPL